jgi:serine/threonine-protein kinase
MSSTRPPKLARDPGLRVAPVVRAGARIGGRYRVESIVGRGGMGLVVAALDEQTGARVAVKLLLPHACESASFARRAMREARAAAALKSEHATRVLAVGRLDSDLPYLVMELLEGTDFERLLTRRGKLTVGEVATCLVQACDAIGEAHARGIVHRDLKPSNLFRTHRRDGTTLVKLMDFGISKLVEADRGALTPTPDSPGTPRYMSPEQLLSARRVDSRTDVWALGVIAFRMLTGKHPFDGETAAAVHIAIAQSPVPSLADAEPHVPAPIVRVIERCLTKSPAERLPTVRALADVLLPFADADTQRRFGSVRDVVRVERARSRPRSQADSREPMSQVLRLGARGRADRRTYGGLLAAGIHVALGLWATGWPWSFAARAWAGAELGVLPIEDVSGDSHVYVLDEGAFGETGEVVGEPVSASNGGLYPGFRGGLRPAGHDRDAILAKASTDAVVRAAGMRADPVPEWLRAALGSQPSGASESLPSSPPVAGEGDADTAAAGTESTARASDVGGQMGTSPEKQPLPRGQARPAMLLPNWDCEYPGPPTHDAAVRLIATVRADGTTESVDILSDPGGSFADAARECALRQPFSPALDERGRRIRGRTRPFVVRFVP